MVLQQAPYAGQVLYNDNFTETLYRVYVEEVDGIPQGTVFRMSGDDVIRTGSMIYDQNGRIWATNGGFSEQWGRVDTTKAVLSLLEWQENAVFEMLQVNTLATGFEITFSDSLSDTLPALHEFGVYRWTFKDHVWENGERPHWIEQQVDGVRLSPDQKKLFLDLPTLQAGSRYFISMPMALHNNKDEQLYSPEAWVTVNRLPRAETLVRSGE